MNGGLWLSWSVDVRFALLGDPWNSKFIEMHFGDHTDCNLEGCCRNHSMWTQCISQNLLFWCEVCVSGGGHHIRIHDCRRQVAVLLIKFLKCGHKWRN
jgi:hypothetical protein